MHFSTLVAGAVAVAGGVAHAATFDVQVGVGTELIYSPNDITAAINDEVVFHFNPKNHTVAQSSFAQPCVPLTGGFYSGFVPTTVPSDTTFTITVTDLKPIWFYCAQTVGSHCQKGMVGAINPPATGNTLAAFVALAAKTNVSTAAPIAGVGGVLSNSASSSNSASNATVTTAALSSSTSAIATFTGAASTIAGDMVKGLVGVAAALVLL